jgi:hypothetical protein
MGQQPYPLAIVSESPAAEKASSSTATAFKAFGIDPNEGPRNVIDGALAQATNSGTEPPKPKSETEPPIGWYDPEIYGSYMH